jgi:hypothetical protein
MKRIALRPAISQDWSAVNGGGMQFEFGAIIDGLGHVLAAIVADEADESLWFEIYIDGKAVQIPLAAVRAAIDAAPSQVHSEAWYDSNSSASSTRT